MSTESTKEIKDKKYKIYCGECRYILNRYGTISSLLSDSTVKIITSNRVSATISNVNDPYVVECCDCVVKDLGCLRCGNIIGYNIIQPCTACLKSRNNGHLWLFHIKCVILVENKSALGKQGVNEFNQLVFMEVER